MQYELSFQLLRLGFVPLRGPLQVFSFYRGNIWSLDGVGYTSPQFLTLINSKLPSQTGKIKEFCSVPKLNCSSTVIGVSQYFIVWLGKFWVNVFQMTWTE